MNLATDLTCEYDCVIVGAGIAGLVAAYEIYKRAPSLRLLTLEGSHRIGGDTFPSATRWITVDQRHILKLCNELEIKLRKQVLVAELKRSWSIDTGFCSSLAKFELKRFFSMIDVICVDTCVCSTFTCSMELFIREHLFFTSTRNSIRLLVISVFGLDADEVKASNFLSLCNSWMGITTLFKSFTGEIEEKIFLHPNFFTLIERLEARIEANQIMKHRLVRNIIQYTEFVRIQTESNDTYLTRLVVIAIPAQSISRMTFIPEIPKHVIAHRAKHCVTSFTASYTEPHWKLQGFSGSTLCSNRNIITYGINSNTIAGLMYHKLDPNSSLTQILVKSFLMRHLVQHFGDPMKEPIVWTQNTCEKSQLINASTPCGWNRLIWASTYQAKCQPGACEGFVNGSVQRGKKAAVIALLALRPQTISWMDVNDVQPANVVEKRISWLQRMLASINLNSIYNVAHTCIIAICRML